ncbi:MAG: type II toxin-antitoxin system VapC family toxin [Terracidiphilus sp.]
MKYLLDTHAFLWALEAPEKLSDSSGKIVNDPASGLLLSIATPWELAIKTNSGKLDAAKILQQFDRLIAASAYSLLETRASDVIRAAGLPLHHRDPFDRLLVAQALELHIPIISRDGIFDRYGVRRIWD